MYNILKAKERLGDVLNKVKKKVFLVQTYTDKNHVLKYVMLLLLGSSTFEVRFLCYENRRVMVDIFLLEQFCK